jgi:hypothetical protein
VVAADALGVGVLDTWRRRGAYEPRLDCHSPVICPKPLNARAT